MVGVPHRIGVIGGRGSHVAGVGRKAFTVFATLAGVGSAAQQVGCVAQCLVRLTTDAAVAHGLRREALDDGLHALHFCQRDGTVGAALEVQHVTNAGDGAGIGVRHERCKRRVHVFQRWGSVARPWCAGLGRRILERHVLACGRRAQRVEHQRVVGVVLATLHRSVHAAASECSAALVDDVLPVRGVVVCQHIRTNGVERCARQAHWSSLEALVHDVVAQADGFEGLGAAIAIDGADAHLAHDA